MKSNFEIIRDIDKKIQTLSPEERTGILELLEYHQDQETIAERISEFLGVSYQSIFYLL